MTPGIKLLTSLFDTWQRRNPDAMRQITLPISKQRAGAYYDAVRPEDKDQLHATLENAQASGCVTLEWGKHYDSHLLKRIILKDGPALAKFLGVPLASDIAMGAAASLKALVPEKHGWIDSVVEGILAKWSQGGSVYRFEPGQVNEAALLIKALGAVAENQQEGLDLRTFSAKALGDSKSMERLKDRFSRAWNKHHNTGLDSDELFESLGLLKFAPAVFLKGPCAITLGESRIDLLHTHTYVGLPSDLVSEVTFMQTPDYVLTIENLASFNRHVRGINDNGLIIFSSGFLSPGTSKILRLLDSLLPSTNFYHWGDIDVGGIRIANHIQSQLGRKLHLHLMDARFLPAHGKSSDSFSKSKLARLKTANEEIATLVRSLLHADALLFLEQENIDPTTPI